MQERILIHALAKWPEEEGACRIRATIRSGHPREGDELWFETRDLARKKLTVREVKKSERLSTISLSGMPSDIAALEGGMYLRSE